MIPKMTFISTVAWHLFHFIDIEFRLLLIYDLHSLFPLIHCSIYWHNIESGSTRMMISILCHHSCGFTIWLESIFQVFSALIAIQLWSLDHHTSYLLSAATLNTCISSIFGENFASALYNSKSGNYGNSVLITVDSAFLSRFDFRALLPPKGLFRSRRG